MKLNSYQYDRLIQQFDERRMKARYEAEKRLNEVYEKLPRIKELDDAVAFESIEAGKAALKGDGDAISGLDEKIRRITEEKKSILVSNGYSEDYLEEKYMCPKCRDTGFVDNEPCGCFKSAMSRMAFEESNLNDIIDRENFETFRLDLYSDAEADYDRELKCTPYKNMVQIRKRVKGFIDNFDSDHKNLLIYGNTGLGKTFLTNCIAREILNSGHTVLYYTTFSFMDMLSKYTFKYEDYPKESFAHRESLMSCELLIIDDLGTELTNAFATEQLYSIVNERLLNNLSTVISTNLMPGEINQRYGERIFSRLSKDYDFIKIIGKDIRTL